MGSAWGTVAKRYMDERGITTYGELVSIMSDVGCYDYSVSEVSAAIEDVFSPTPIRLVMGVVAALELSDAEFSEELVPALQDDVAWRLLCSREGWRVS